MKKLLSVISFLFCILQTSFAEAPELKNMMPDSWQNLTRLPSVEEKQFLNQQQVIDDIANFKSYNWGPTEYNIIERRVYKETVNGIEFYRVLVCNQNISDFLSTEYKDMMISKSDYVNYITHRIQQIIYAKQNKKNITKIRSLEYKTYGIADGNMETEGCEYFVFYDFFIKSLNKNEIGIFITEINTGYQRKTKDENYFIEYSKKKNQMDGANLCTFFKVLNKEDISKAINNSGRDVRIQASNFLFDSKCPFKYSIQNALDGNSATSYVENTEDDLMKIVLGVKGGDVTEIALINGYAANEKLYYENNRIKKLGKSKFFNDDSLNYQIIPCFGNELLFTDVYKGEKYNDTCIAEVNLKVNNNWFYGEIKFE